MKKILLIVLLFVWVNSLAGCEVREVNSDKELEVKQENIMKEINKQVWMPAIKNFQEKKLAKMIFELRDQENLKTYTYITAKNTWKLILLCKSIWYGLPYSIQYTNPMKIVDDPYWSFDAGGRVIPQADPNWLFMPEGLSATWVMCIDPETKKPRPVYVENEIVVSPYPLTK